MATFGYSIIGSLTSSLVDYVCGSQFTCPENGTGNKISVALKYATSAWTGNVKCAVYLTSNLSAPITNGQTEQRELTLTGSSIWYDFNFPSAPTFAANTAYSLFGWGDTISGDDARFARADDVTVNRWYEYRVYDGWPSLNASDRTGKFSIYCDYTPSGGGVSIPVVMYNRRMQKMSLTQINHDWKANLWGFR